MNLDKVKSVLDKVKAAAADQVPMGAVLAWSHPNGGSLSWAELIDALESVVAESKQAEKPVDPPKKDKE